MAHPIHVRQSIATARNTICMVIAQTLWQDWKIAMETAHSTHMYTHLASSSLTAVSLMHVNPSSVSMRNLRSPHTCNTHVGARDLLRKHTFRHMITRIRE